MEPLIFSAAVTTMVPRKACCSARICGILILPETPGSLRLWLIDTAAIICSIPVVQKVAGMEVAALKAEFGDRIAFQGGVDTQKLLPLGTPEEVKREAEYVIETMNVNGGYILAPSQDFEGDVPVENILALYEARKKFL